LSAIGFVAASTAFQQATPAQKQFEEQQRQQAAAQPAPAIVPAGPPVQPREELPPPKPPSWTEREPGDWRYLADMPEFDAVVGKPWTFAKDGTTGDPEKHSPIKVGGFASPKGLGMHPPEATFSKVKYKLDRKAQRFKSVGAVSDSSTLLFSPVYFEVWGDGQRLWQSERITQDKQIRECSIDVSDVDVLELRAVAVGHHTGLHAVWLEPRVLMK
jgi:NPCBM/NEW2 domain